MFGIYVQKKIKNCFEQIDTFANKNKKQECGCKETNASGENNMRAHI